MRRFPRARIKRFGEYAEAGHCFQFCREVAGITDYDFARKLWRQYIAATEGPNYYD